MRPRRLCGVSYVGPQRYFLTLCTFARRQHFTRAGLISDVWMEFVRAATRLQFANLAYCFMPDHLHLVTEGTSTESDLESFVRDAKQRGAHSARKWIGGRLWQPGYFERVLRHEDDLIDVARYVVQNPVRAGLVQRASEYPFLGAGLLSKEQLIESCAWRPR